MTFSSTLDTQKDISFHWFVLQLSINNDTCIVIKKALKYTRDLTKLARVNKKIGMFCLPVDNKIQEYRLNDQCFLDKKSSGVLGKSSGLCKAEHPMFLQTCIIYYINKSKHKDYSGA